MPSRRFLAMTATAIACCAAAGCNSSLNPFTYGSPPGGPMQPGDDPTRSAIILGDFDDPTGPGLGLGWVDIGGSLHEALVRSIVADGRFQIVSETDASASAWSLLNNFTDDRAGDLARLHRRVPGAEFYVQGAVTDFTHSTELPESARRWGLLGRRNEAIVAIDLQAWDLRTGRLVASEHLVGTAGAKRESIQVQYRGVQPSSYLFWSTPLGRASRKVVKDSARIIDRLEPSPDRVASRASTGVGAWRSTRVAGDAVAGD